MSALLLCAFLLQSAPGAPPAAKTGIIRGRVVVADTGRPLARATVTVIGAGDGRPIGLSGSTNSLGRYEIKDVPAGAYLVAASRRGYLALRFGQRRPSERGLTVDVGDGAPVEDVDVALPRPGVLGGRVTDELGEPYPGVQVIALTTRYVRGRRTVSPAAFSTTNDLGQFRLASLAPGTYTVVAMSPETWRNERQETFGYATTYHPGGSAALAQPIALAVSQQRLDLDFAMRPSRAVRVSGHIVTDNGRPATAPGVDLSYAFGDGALITGIRTGRVAADGSFEVKDVTEGTYRLYTTGALEQTVSVAEADVTDLTLVTMTAGGTTVAGSVMTEDGSVPPFRVGAARVTLEAPLGRVMPTVRDVPPDADWTFTLQGLAGPYLFRLAGLPDGWTLGAVRLGERDIIDTPWDVPPGGRDVGRLQMIVTRKSGTISGSVVDAIGKPTAAATLVLFADDDKLWMAGSRFTRVLRPGRDGRFVIAGLPAGTYRIIAREFIEEGQWDDRAFLEGIRDQAMRIGLGEGATQVITLKLEAR